MTGTPDPSSHAFEPAAAERPALQTPPTLQTSAPLERATLTQSATRATWFRLLAGEDCLELAAPYQRGSVWTLQQRRLLFKSFLLGVPVPTVIVNDRYAAGFVHPDGSADVRYAVVDGKQRVETVLAWFASDLAVPASWFPREHVESAVETDDGPYVTWGGLTRVGQTFADSRLVLPCAAAKLARVEDELELYLLLNMGGRAHTQADLDAALGQRRASSLRGSEGWSRVS